MKNRTVRQTGIRRGASAPAAALVLALGVGIGAAALGREDDGGPPRLGDAAIGLQVGYEPPAKPACVEEAIGALGVLEPAGQAHRIGAPGEGVVAQVMASVGRKVRAGEALFAMDDRAARAALALSRRSLALAEAKARALQAEFRRNREAARAAEAALAAAEATAADANDLSAIAERLGEGAVLSARERTHRRLAAARAQADVAKAAARFAEAAAERDAVDPSRPGARVLVAQAEVAEARARMEAAAMEVERLVVRAPVAGRVLAVAVRTGERIERGAAAPVLLAAGGPAHLRVEIDALDLARFSPSAKATAQRRGSSTAAPIELRLLRLEPLVRAKSHFADALNEAIDRRVATAIYTLPENAVEHGTARYGELLAVRIAPPCAGAANINVAMRAPL